MQKVLVAGATGYLGRYVAREFKSRGYWVRVLARNPEKLKQTGSFLEPAIISEVNDVFVSEVTRKKTLKSICSDIDIVFSSIGITRQRDKVSFWDVDYQGNKNILEIALNSRVKKFIFVSVFNADLLQHIPGINAREAFVAELQQTGLDYTIIRPTGYFSDMSEVLRMAMSGRVYLIGSGRKRLNPIHGADLARVCVGSVDNSRTEISAGGPETFTHYEIAELAFSVAGIKPNISRIPVWLADAMVKMVRPFNEHYYSLAAFFTSAMKMDFVAPATGTHKLADYYRQILPLLRKK